MCEQITLPYCALPRREECRGRFMPMAVMVFFFFSSMPTMAMESIRGSTAKDYRGLDMPKAVAAAYAPAHMC